MLIGLAYVILGELTDCCCDGESGVSEQGEARGGHQSRHITRWKLLSVGAEVLSPPLACSGSPSTALPG